MSRSPQGLSEQKSHLPGMSKATSGLRNIFSGKKFSLGAINRQKRQA